MRREFIFGVFVNKLWLIGSVLVLIGLLFYFKEVGETSLTKSSNQVSVTQESTQESTQDVTETSLTKSLIDNGSKDAVSQEGVYPAGDTSLVSKNNSDSSSVLVNRKFAYSPPPPSFSSRPLPTKPSPVAVDFKVLSTVGNQVQVQFPDRVASLSVGSRLYDGRITLKSIDSSARQVVFATVDGDVRVNY